MASPKQEESALQRRAVKLIQAQKNGRQLTREEKQFVSDSYNRAVNRSMRGRQ